MVTTGLAVVIGAASAALVVPTLVLAFLAWSPLTTSRFAPPPGREGIGGRGAYPVFSVLVGMFGLSMLPFVLIPMILLPVTYSVVRFLVQLVYAN
jgi:hypothetical protein